jgi:hypothetical protein
VILKSYGDQKIVSRKFSLAGRLQLAIIYLFLNLLLLFEVLSSTDIARNSGSFIGAELLIWIYLGMTVYSQCYFMQCYICRDQIYPSV